MREIPIIENVLRMKHAEEMLSVLVSCPRKCYNLNRKSSTKRVLELAKNTMY